MQNVRQFCSDLCCADVFLVLQNRAFQQVTPSELSKLTIELVETNFAFYQTRLAHSTLGVL